MSLVEVRTGRPVLGLERRHSRLEYPSIDVKVVQVVLTRKGQNGNEFLLGKRSAGGFLHQWSFLGGKVDAGESNKGAAVRELQEEAGVVLSEDDLTHVFFTDSSTIRWTNGVATRHHYEGEVFQADGEAVAPFNASPGEHSELRWMTYEEAVSMHARALEDERMRGASRSLDTIPDALAPRTLEILQRFHAQQSPS
jgi:8-oxo-dGTP pyrophosphatase MutT (NUDIX family)